MLRDHLSVVLGAYVSKDILPIWLYIQNNLLKPFSSLFQVLLLALNAVNALSLPLLKLSKILLNTLFHCYFYLLVMLLQGQFPIFIHLLYFLGS
jgi:hypothetical protein